MVMLAAAVSLRFFPFWRRAKDGFLSGVGAGFLLYVLSKVTEDLSKAELMHPIACGRAGAVCVGEGLGARRIDGLPNRVVEGPAIPVATQSPSGVFEAELRIVDDGAMLEGAHRNTRRFDAGCLVGDPAAGRELAGRGAWWARADEPDLPARAAGPGSPLVEISLTCRQGHVAERFEQARPRPPWQASIGLPPPERDQRIGTDPLGLGHKGPATELAGHMLPDAPRTRRRKWRAHRRR